MWGPHVILSPPLLHRPSLSPSLSLHHLSSSGHDGGVWRSGVAARRSAVGRRRKGGGGGGQAETVAGGGDTGMAGSEDGGIRRWLPWIG
ncbi:Os01g0330650 [Oryza sativa Japonica Group]|uniref:Os01g0330650 protein n=1 Tax=Oryza sativa subsp. japonica TaxID=39947 RepID=A0A0P0V2A1_ORYSJ|nr:hypothetical protein EE612_002279 [Oryza sativa]BAS71912.1 Os01g0330650 [Oryza sativa Japonica Group]